MDKVQKIRKEVARIQAYTQSDVLKEVLDYIDKVQEEPKFKTGDHIKPIDSSLGAPRTILEVCDGWYVTNQGTLDFEFEDNWELVEEPVSEDLEKEIEQYEESFRHKSTQMGYKETAHHFAQWQKEQMMKDAVECKIECDTPYGMTIPKEAVKKAVGNTLAQVRDKVKVIIIKEE